MERLARIAIGPLQGRQFLDGLSCLGLGQAPIMKALKIDRMHNCAYAVERWPRDDEGDGERYVRIGMDALGNVLVVVYTWRGDRPRLISARKAKPQEREQYGVKP
jgi:uncharacterized DUF497 family protein